ncbi:MAG: hypothetical protein HXX13_04355 [Bacteroidetes bacterium]|nr:hypothetical protein [Bacteroidota bacterium]
MKIYIYIIRYSIAIALLYSCNQASSTKESKDTDPTGKMMRFRKYSYIDQQGTGIEAFSFLMPSEWKFDGGMNWILDNPAMPSVTSFRVFNPKGKEEFEVFPNHCYFWTNNPQLLGMFPVGSKYFGSSVLQPISARDALKQVILSEERSQVQGLSITKDEDLPELATAVGAGKQSIGGPKPTGAKLRIIYQKNGIPMEEEFYGVTECITFPVQSMFGTYYNTIWYIDYIFSFKAERGNLERNSKIFQTITASFKLNPKWYAKYSHVIEYMAQQQIRQIHSVGEFSRMLSQMSDQMSNEQLQQFESRGEVYDKVSEKFSDNMLGIDRYFDPHESRQVELPSGYNHAWSNNNGEYIMTDNPNFNPNENSNLHWEPMEKK